MNDLKKDIQLFPLPGHSCSGANNQWEGRYSSYELRQGISVNIAKISVSQNLANIYKIGTSYEFTHQQLKDAVSLGKEK